MDDMTAMGLLFGVVLLLIFGAKKAVTLWMLRKIYKFFGGK